MTLELYVVCFILAILVISCAAFYFTCHHILAQTKKDNVIRAQLKQECLGKFDDPGWHDQYVCSEEAVKKIPSLAEDEIGLVKFAVVFFYVTFFVLLFGMYTVWYEGHYPDRCDFHNDDLSGWIGECK